MFGVSFLLYNTQHSKHNSLVRESGGHIDYCVLSVISSRSCEHDVYKTHNIYKTHNLLRPCVSTGSKCVPFIYICIYIYICQQGPVATLCVNRVEKKCIHFVYTFLLGLVNIMYTHNLLRLECHCLCVSGGHTDS